MPVNILDHYYGIIHQHADRESDTGQAYNIEIPPHNIEQGKCADNADGYGQSHDSSGAQAP